ncbi:hemolysin family protein [Thermovirga sp.]|uniref:hemolysin family protein n=1 Tax=Thermovirga sp. TaxID=2699834 RepID=UPI00345B4BE1
MVEDIYTGFVVLAVLLFCSAFFSASETAITIVGRGRLLALEEKFPQKKKTIEWLLADMQKVLSVILIGNNLVNIAASAVATSVCMLLFGQKGLLIAVGGMTVFIVIFGEILPKSVAISHFERIVLVALPILRLFSYLVLPLLSFVRIIVQFIGAIFKLDIAGGNTFVTREEIEQMVNIGEASGAIEEEERRMIHGVISFEETKVYEIMIPRTDMVAVAGETTLGEAVKVFEDYGHSRVPVFEDNVDNITGILYVKDVMGVIVAGKLDIPVKELKREALFVPETMKIADLFDVMRNKRVHMAIVVDEYGGTAGLVTLEDLLEEIVGEIQDEYDRETPLVNKKEDGSYMVKGYIDLEDLSEALDYNFESDEADTLGGLILSLSGHFPEQGQHFRYGPWDIEVVEVSKHRIRQARLTLVEDAPEEDGLNSNGRDKSNKHRL